MGFYLYKCSMLDDFVTKYIEKEHQGERNILQRYKCNSSSYHSITVIFFVYMKKDNLTDVVVVVQIPLSRKQILVTLLPLHKMIL